ncbi:MAG: rhomboid family intramembrane serine protease [Candidatus Methanomethylophilaceae archaeon]
MEDASIIIVAIIAVTLALMYSSRYNPVKVGCVSIIVIFFISYILTGGDTSVIWRDLGFCTMDPFAAENLYRFITSMFIHSDFVHLFANVLFILILGIPLSRRVSPFKVLLLILFTEVGGEALYAVTTPEPQILIGASIVVAGLVGMILAMFPDLDIVLPSPIDNTGVKIWMPAVFWIALQVIMAFGILGSQNVAYSAHVFGFIVGFVVGLASKSTLIPWTVLRSPEQYIDVTILEKYCVTDIQKKMYAEAIRNDDPAERDVWAREIVKDVVCPKCGKNFTVLRGKVVCSNGHIVREFESIHYSDKEKIES